jgi:hypothetical protein
MPKKKNKPTTTPWYCLVSPETTILRGMARLTPSQLRTENNRQKQYGSCFKWISKAQYQRLQS